MFPLNSRRATRDTQTGTEGAKLNSSDAPEIPEVRIDEEIDQQVDNNQPIEESDEEDLVPEPVEIALKAILNIVEKEDSDIRESYIRVWRQLQEYGKGIQDIYWDEVAVDWRSFTLDDREEIGPSRNINIFRAHMESVVAALSIKTPGTDFFPDDADNPLDCETADGYSAVADLIQKHNRSALLVIKALYIMWTQGTAFVYNYYRTDPKFGSIQIPQKVQRQITTYDVFCQNCGNHIGTVKETPPTSPLRCEYCGTTEIPTTKEYPETIERIVGYETAPKGRECLKLFGPINVKVSLYAKEQEDCGYLLLKFDSNYAMLRNIFVNNREDISETTPSDDTYERDMRLASEYRGQVPRDLNTVKCLWIRPWMYQYCVEEQVRDFLFEKYSTGLYCIYIGDKLFSIEEENLDDHWSISVDPLSDFIHNEPLGKPLAPIQEMRNDLTDLKFQTIEYGIAENFANPKVLDFQKYNKERSAPGMFTAVTPVAGQAIGDAFFQTEPAHLSSEVNSFGQELDTDAQFVVGDFPSVYGGPSEGSKTAFEYDKSNAQALQRLSLTWKRLVNLWTDVMGKSVVEFVEHMKEDERNVKKENGRFINTWIRKQSLTGKIGSVEPETSEQLPQTWEQKWHLITNLLGMQDPVINSVVLAPENAHLMKNAVSMPQFYIPGDHDRTKQFGELYDLVADPNDPSVQVDPDLDDHEIHMKIIKYHATSPQGVQTYKTNPAVYQAWLMHYKMHEQALMIQSAGLGQPGQSQGNLEAPPPGSPQ